MILAEGYMDVISINQAGFENVVATLGTSLTSDQARLMKSYADEVIISYDSDSAGQKATQRAINLLSEAGINTRIIKMNGAKDPDEFIKKFELKDLRCFWKIPTVQLILNWKNAEPDLTLTAKLIR